MIKNVGLKSNICSFKQTNNTQQPNMQQGPKLVAMEMTPEVAEAFRSYCLTKGINNAQKTENKFSNDIENIKLFSGLDKDMISTVIEKIGAEDIEYSEKDNITKLYIKNKNGFTYNMTMGKVSDNAIAGLVSKEYKDGQNELFLARIDFINTNKSKKMQVSFMPVVQKGIDDSTIAEAKDEKTITINAQDRQKQKNNVTKMAESGHISGGYSGLFSAGIINGNFATPSEITSDVIKNIGGAIQISNAPARRISTFSIDNSGKLSITGAEIGRKKDIAVPIKKHHKDWDLVKGPHGNMFEVPKHILLTEDGLDGDNIWQIIYDADTDWHYDEKGTRVIQKKSMAEFLTGSISSKEDLLKVIDLATQLLNGASIQRAENSYTTFRNHPGLTDVVEVARAMVIAEDEFNKEQ